MRVLIDACLPVRIKQHLTFSLLKTARELGWQKLKNGELLAMADGQFDVLLTMDKSLPNQQTLRRFSVGVVIIRARSNRLCDLIALAPAIQAAALRVKPGCAEIVS